MPNDDTKMFRINDLLYFLNFKRKTTSVADVVTICESFYSADAILEAKKLFFDCVAEKVGDKNDGVLRFVDRRGKAGNTAQKWNLEDLIAAMHKCDNDGVELPTFVSSDLSKVPSSNDGNVSLNQIMFMMVEMKEKIASLEKRNTCACVPTTDLRGNAVVRPASFAASMSASSPEAAAPPSSASPGSADSLADSSLSLSSSSSSSLAAPAAPTAAAAAATAAAAAAAAAATAANSSALPTATNENWNTVAAQGAKSHGRPPIQSAENRIKGNFQRNRNIVIGKGPSSGVMSWTGADLTVEGYIGRVALSVAADTIKADLISRGIDVIRLEENETRHQRFKSFKLVVKKSDFDILLKQGAWPEGVLFRRFWKPRQANTGPEQTLVT